MAISDFFNSGNDAQPLLYVYRYVDGSWALVEELDPGSDVANNPAVFSISDVTISDGLIFGGASAGTIENGGLVFVTAYPIQPVSVAVSDGLYKDRIQVRWTDSNKVEDGFNVYRRDDEGTLQLVGTTDADVTTFNDFSAAPGNAYEYCVTAFITELQATDSPLAESLELCDVGWRPTNGVIAGQVLGEGGGGTQDAEIAITPTPNNALLFDGAGGYVEAPYNPSLDLNRFTVEAWVYPQEVMNTFQPLIVKKGDEGRNYGIYITGGGMKIHYSLQRSNCSTFQSYNSDGQLTLNTWNHIAAAYDGTTFAFYINGELDQSNTFTTDLCQTTGPLEIGKSSAFPEFRGLLDDVRIWNEGRTITEIQEHMNVMLTGEEDGLVGYWPFDQGARGIAPDLTSSAAHGELIDGVHWSDNAAPLAINATTDAAGNYTFSGLRYGEGDTFTLTPTLDGRSFSPAFKTITLSTENPVENEVSFTDETAFTLAGRVLYDNTVCPVADAELFMDGVATGATESDGTFALNATPSDPVDLTDTRTLTLSAGSGANTHPFSPASFTYVADQDTTGLLFYDQQTFELSGFYGGGTASCSHYVGDLTLKIITENGCFQQEVALSSFGDYSVSLPPQEYLVSVEVDPNTIPAGIDAADVIDYFEDLGQMEVNLTTGADTLDVAYRAPLAVTISGFPSVANSCAASGYNVVDSGGSVLRTLPAVPVIGEYEVLPLTIEVVEDYGTSGTCPVTDGAVTIFDSIGDVEDPQTAEVTTGVVSYTTVGASPDVIANRFDGGEDRSYQKSFTVVAEVEGSTPVTETVWALVEGFRERQSTFVTFSTDEMPLWILHDPPGSNSYAYVEEGFTSCRRLKDIEFTSTDIGLVTNFEIGFKQSTGVAAGAIAITEGGFGFYNRFNALETTGKTELGTEPSREICITTKQRFQTSAEPYSVSDHLYVGAGLNLIFAEADRLTTTGTCTITQDVTLAADLDLENTFSTTYVYSKKHIEHTLLPELANLAELLGDGTDGTDTSSESVIDFGNSGPVTQDIVESAQINWGNHLELGATNTVSGLSGNATNYSFSGGGSAFENATTVDTTATIDLDYRVDINTYTEEFGFLATKFGYDNRVGAHFNFTTESVTEEEDTEVTSQTIGYVLSDPDVGDFFSVDVGTDPVYGTPVFQTVSGRSSVPHEEGTQQRDNPEVEINPPVIFDADPDEAANFQVTVINNSESGERRVYTLAVPGETNTRNLSITTTGDLLGGERLESFTREPGEARTINHDVLASPSAYSYEDVGLVLYSAEEFELWLKDPRGDFGA
ncbi:MAG: LamG domain-containing protein, partial [Bacteroidota bacterium]